MRGRVSDPFQPLRAAHIPNAPGFAGGWLPGPHSDDLALVPRLAVSCVGCRFPRWSPIELRDHEDCARSQQKPRPAFYRGAIKIKAAADSFLAFTRTHGPGHLESFVTGSFLASHLVELAS